MNDVLRRVCGPDSVSLPAGVALAFVMFFSNFNSSGIDSRQHFWAIVLAWALSLSAAFGLLVLAKFTLLRGAAERPLVWSTLLAFAVAFLARAVVFDRVVWMTGASEQPDLLYRLAASLPTFGFGLLICAYIVSIAREFSRNLQHIAAIREEIADLEASAAQRVRAHREELLEFVQSTLKRDLATVLGEAPPAALERMRATIEQVVRPVSRQLASSMPDLELPRAPAGQAIAWSTVVRNMFVGNPVRPVWFALWTAGAAWSITISRLVLIDTVAYVLLVGAASYVAQELASVGWRRVARAALGWRVGYFVAAGLGSGIAVNLVARLFAPVASNQPGLLFAYALISLGIATFIAVVTSLRRELNATIPLLELCSQELRGTLVSINTQLREQRLAIGRALHGPVQDRITVAAFRLADAIADGKADPALIAELSAPIERAIDETSRAEPHAVDVRHSVAELAELWLGVVEIQVDLSDAVAHLMSRFPASGHTVVEVIREACANAIRHGEARRVWVQLTVGDRPKSVRVSVRNDGSALPEQPAGGVGSLLLDELTLEWTRRSDATETVLTALVPLVASR